MAIAFPCRHCGKTVNAPASMAGKRAACPFCKNVVDVPVPLEPEEEPSPSEADEQASKEPAALSASAVSSTPEKITVACEHCRKKIRMPAKAVGKKARCPNCKELFRVIAPASNASEKESTERNPEESPQPALKLKLKLALPTKPSAESPLSPTSPEAATPAPQAPIAQSPVVAQSSEDDLFTFADEPAPITPAVAALQAAKPKPPEPELLDLTEEEPPAVETPAKSSRPKLQLQKPAEEAEVDLTPVSDDLSLDALSPFADAHSTAANNPWGDLGPLANGPALANSNPYASPSGDGATSVKKEKKVFSNRGRTGLPWDNEQSLGSMIATTKLVLIESERGFACMKIDDASTSFMYFFVSFGAAVFFGTILMVVPVLVALQSAGEEIKYEGLFFLLISQVIGTVIISLFGGLLCALALHIGMLFTWSVNRGFKATYIGVNYLLGSSSLVMLIPFVGPFIAIIAAIVATVRLLRTLHDLSILRAILSYVFAIIGPFILWFGTCGCLIGVPSLILKSVFRPRTEPTYNDRGAPPYPTYPNPAPDRPSFPSRPSPFPSNPNMPPNRPNFPSRPSPFPSRP